MSQEETVFTTEELKALESIDEEIFQPTISSIIDDIYINMNPKSVEIKKIIDLRRIGPNRQMFYLAKAIDRNYY